MLVLMAYFFVCWYHRKDEYRRLRTGMKHHRCYIEHVPDVSDTINLTGPEARHLCRVMRRRAGDRVTLFTRDGRSFAGTIVVCGRDAVQVRIDAAVAAGGPAAGRIVMLCPAVTKAKSMDFTIQKCTELGVDRFVPCVTARSVPRWDAAARSARQRHWQSVALSAVKQSGVRAMPEVAPVVDFDGLLEHDDLHATEKIILWEDERQQGLGAVVQALLPDRPIALLVGPEGGFLPEEVRRAQLHGFTAARLGDGILRSETACVAAVTIVRHVTGSLG